MDIDLGELYEREIQEIVQDLEASSREAGVDNSPARKVKAEMIEREEGSRESRRKGDGKMSSESADETEHIVMEDSMEGEVCMVRSMIQDEEGEPNPPRDVVTPVMESTPVEGREKRKGYTGFRPLTAPKKKMWVQPETEVKEEEEEKSSDEESSTSWRSTLSAISIGRRVPVKEEAQTRVISPHNSPPRRYGDRASQVRVRFNQRTQLREVVDAAEGYQTGTGGRRNPRARNDRGRDVAGDEESDEDTGIEDLDDHLIRLIESTTSHSLSRPTIGSRTVPLIRTVVPARQDLAQRSYDSYEDYDNYEEDRSEHFY